METLSEAIQNYMAIIHKTIPLEWLDCPEIQAAEIALEAALERLDEN